MDSKSNCVVLDTKYLTHDQIRQVIHWCDENIGSDKWNFIAGFPSYHWRFYLPDSTSETLFRLRWVH